MKSLTKYVPAEMTVDDGFNEHNQPSGQQHVQECWEELGDDWLEAFANSDILLSPRGFIEEARTSQARNPGLYACSNKGLLYGSKAIINVTVP
jgi:hypothetical protein